MVTFAVVAGCFLVFALAPFTLSGEANETYSADFVSSNGLSAGTPVLGSTPAQPGIFYVTDYSASGTHTDYDMARQAADAYAGTNLWTGSVLVLKPTANITRDAVPLRPN
jgi:hypothetical protein